MDQSCTLLLLKYKRTIIRCNRKSKESRLKFPHQTRQISKNLDHLDRFDSLESRHHRQTRVRCEVSVVVAFVSVVFGEAVFVVHDSCSAPPVVVVLGVDQVVVFVVVVLVVFVVFRILLPFPLKCRP